MICEDCGGDLVWDPSRRKYRCVNKGCMVLYAYRATEAGTDRERWVFVRGAAPKPKGVKQTDIKP